MSLDGKNVPAPFFYSLNFIFGYCKGIVNDSDLELL